MSSKSRGCEYERKLVHLLRKNGLIALRISGSGSMRYPLPDVLASDGKKIFAFEVKSSKKGYIYLTENDLNKLIEFSSSFGAEPFFAIHINGTWLFKQAKELIGQKTIRLDEKNTYTFFR